MRTPRIITQTKRVPFAQGKVFFVFCTCLLCVAGVFGAIALGKTDSGQIDVNAVIETAYNDRVDAGGDASIEAVYTTPPALRNLPHGGLVPLDRKGQVETETETETTAEEATTETAVEGAGDETTTE